MEKAVAPNGADVNGVVSTSDLVKALNHPTRRSILRFLLKKAPASSTEVRSATPGRERLNFHFEILVETGAVTRHEKRIGCRENFYSPSAAIQARWCLTVLKLTAKED
jgi:DNA-binding transcriptional ArsR family regulator